MKGQLNVPKRVALSYNKDFLLVANQLDDSLVFERGYLTLYIYISYQQNPIYNPNHIIDHW